MRRRTLALTIVELLVVIAIIVVLVALMMPAVRTARPAARRNACMNNLKQIALALLNYEDANGTLPPAFTVDEEGNRLHSWRTLILPYMEQTALYESIDLTRPWDDPVNAKARDAVIHTYWCPSANHKHGLTTYLGIVGPDCVFTGSEPRKLNEVQDDRASTMMVVDVDDDQAVHWMSPEDATVELVLAYVQDPEVRLQHPGVMQACCLDGHGVSFGLDFDPTVLRSMMTIAAGDNTND